MEPILVINELVKHYGKVEAVKGISFRVEKGQIFGILGPNGSGKTTTLAVLLGILKPTKGSFSWFGNGATHTNRLSIGTLLETPNFYPYLNAYDNLRVVAKIKEIKNAEKRITEVLERVDLLERGKRPFRTYSLGMKQRLAVASAILSDPEVLVLDEPTNGLDPMGIIEMRNLISSIAKDGKTIIIASHILDEIEKICTHVAIMKEGVLLSSGSLDQILSQTERYLLKSDDQPKLSSLLETLPQFKIINDVDVIGIVVEPFEAITGSALNRLIAENGVYLSELSVYRKNLETIFIETVK